MEWILQYRTDELTQFFQLFPYLVSETFFISVVLIGYLGFERGFYRDLFAILAVATLLNVFIKSLFMIPRPEILHLANVSDPYGFPSGDVMSATVFLLMLSVHYQKKWLWLLSFILIPLVMLSRMYLGVHSHFDVVAGAGLGMVLTWLYFSMTSKSFISSKLMHLFGLIFVLFIAPWVLNVGYKFLIATYGLLLGIMIGDIIKLKFALRDDFVQHRWTYVILGFLGFIGLSIVTKDLPVIGSMEVTLILSKTLLGIALIWALPKLIDMLFVLKSKVGK